MKKVLSPISLKKMSKKPERRPSRNGSSPTRPGMNAAPGAAGDRKRSVAACEMDGVAASNATAKVAANAELFLIVFFVSLLLLLFRRVGLLFRERVAAGVVGRAV